MNATTASPQRRRALIARIPIGIALILPGAAIGVADVAAAGSGAVAPAVEVVDGCVTVPAGVPTRAAVEGIAAHLGLALFLDAPLEDPVRSGILRADPHDALIRILRGRNFLLSPHAGGISGGPWVVTGRLHAGSPGQRSAAPGNPPPAPQRTAENLIARLRRDLSDPEPAARLAALADLASFDTPDVTRSLALIARHDGHAALRAEGVEALGDARGVGDEAFIARVLEGALGDPEARVRRAAVSSIARRGGDREARALIAALSDVSPDVREDAVDALATIGGAIARDGLILALFDRNPAVRAAAEEAIASRSGAPPSSE